MSSAAYPVRVDARLDEGLSRWLWLVKWLLAIPHYFVLAFLWIAYLVLSLVAMAAIVVTGRYPRGIFDFNVGVLRWTWRVMYYAYDGLGTDRYPPFTLHDVPDYPAHLEVAYPEHLSRGLALVKWWLLAIPHYVVVGFLVGGGYWATNRASSNDGPLWTWGSGLIGFLVLVAAVVLLVTGRYPRGVFDLVLGLDRWVLRVTAYASLMTDQYPPFRLDMGGDDPGTVLAPDPPASAPAAGVATAPATRRTPPAHHWTAGRVLAVVIASLVALLAATSLLVSALFGLTDRVVRDDDGYVSSGTVAVASPGHAVVLSADLGADGSAVVDLPQRTIGTVRVTADAGSSPVFVGIARTADTDAYLRGVSRSVVTDLDGPHGRPTYDQVRGVRTPARPADQDFWVASSSGTGEISVRADAEHGDWTVVVMDPSGAPGLRADVKVGATLPVLGDLAVAMLVVGLVLGALASVGIWLAVPRHSGADAGRPGPSAADGDDR